ncbi:MAG: chemotaxis protein CheD, partial [Chloroflexi bacterium]|nr:chemotaxis protein CheD [Chloroflexota bacterium]
VCLWDPGLRAGGINHFLLPEDTESSTDPSRVARPATRFLIDALCGLGTAPSSLRAKIVGGAQIGPSAAGGLLGRRNAEAALAALEASRIAVVSMHVGGSAGRQLRFHTDTGEAWVKAL